MSFASTLTRALPPVVSALEVGPSAIRLNGFGVPDQRGRGPPGRDLTEPPNESVVGARLEKEIAEALCAKQLALPQERAEVAEVPEQRVVLHSIALSAVLAMPLSLPPWRLRRAGLVDQPLRMQADRATQGCRPHAWGSSCNNP